MEKKIIKYHNDLNLISFAGFKEKELNLFFTICYKLKEKGTGTVNFNFIELQEFIEVKNKKTRLKEYILELNKKLLNLNQQIEIEKNVFLNFVLFTTLKSDFNKNELEVSVNKPFLYILNNLVEKYTRFDLLDFVSLKSAYSKILFRLLKQWETKKEKTFCIDEFKFLLGVPKSYTTANFNERVLKQVMKELSPVFNNLQIEKIKTGKKITSLKFIWESKKDTKIIFEKIELEITEYLYSAICKARKNRFIEKILKDENVETLLHIFTEDELVKGLNFSYKEIKQEIKTLNYLIKTIKTGIAKKEVELKIKENEFIDISSKKKKTIGEKELNELEPKKELSELELKKKNINLKIMQSNLKMKDRIELNVILEKIENLEDLAKFEIKNNLKGVV